jgi:hypothetical protein
VQPGELLRRRDLHAQLRRRDDDVRQRADDLPWQLHLRERDDVQDRVRRGSRLQQRHALLRQPGRERHVQREAGGGRELHERQRVPQRQLRRTGCRQQRL